MTDTDNNVIEIKDEYNGEITLVGTVHISKTTRDRVLRTISRVNPDVVAIELDSERLYKMFEKQADVVNGNVNSTSNLRFADIMRKQQEKLVEGKEGLLYPGEADMLPAVDKAMDIGSDIALIDVSIDDLKKQVKRNAFTDGKIDIELLNKSFDEIVHNLKSLVNSRMEVAEKLKENNGIETFVEEMEEAPLSDVGSEFDYIENIAPEIVDALIDERDKHMAGHLHWLRQEGVEVVAVMGKGHLNGVTTYLDEPDTIPDKYVVEPDWYNYSMININ